MKDENIKGKEVKQEDSNELSFEDMKKASGGHGTPVVSNTKNISKKEKERV